MKLATTMEQLWLRALPRLTRDYLSVSVDGLRLYGSTQHHLMLYWLLRGSYERFTRKLFQRALEPGMHALDIGAHIGYYTLLAARGVGPTGRVYSFECDPTNFRFLRHNVALNGMGKVVTTISKAAAETSGVRPFFANGANSLKSSLWNDGKASRETVVECTTVDGVVQAGEEIHLVKIDVEGGELYALQGMRATLAGSERLVMFVECNPRALAAAGASASALLEELRQLELDVQLIDEKRRCLLPVTDELARPELEESNYYANLYCTKGTVED